jgi:hypothetical protein
MRMTTPCALPTREQCIRRAAAALARASAEAAWVCAEGGAQAVAQQAFEPGGTSAEEIAAQYVVLDARARAETTKCSTSAGWTAGPSR